jgi:hypothetical protein
MAAKYFLMNVKQPGKSIIGFQMPVGRTLLKYIFVIAILLAYFILKAQTTGEDINIFLYAAKSLMWHNNIYKNPPQIPPYYNSPLFALFLTPLSCMNWVIARFIWSLIIFAVVIRLFIVSNQLIMPYIQEKYKKGFYAAVVFFSLGFLNLNLCLGQVTIVILWLTIEGIVQVLRGKEIRGAALLALGINIKIFPFLALFYLVLKKKYAAVVITLIFLCVYLFLPAIFIGFDYNKELLKQWAMTINPAKRYFFENGAVSFNSILPAFFSNTVKDELDSTFRRTIFTLTYSQLVIVMQTVRLFFLALSAVMVLYPGRKKSGSDIYVFREIACLMLISLLILPHQTKPSMVYAIPAFAYVMLFFINLYAYKKAFTLPDKIVGAISFVIIFTLTVSGRDIIGNYCVNILDYFHFMGLSLIFFLAVLFYCQPNRLSRSVEPEIQKNKKAKPTAAV